MKKQILDISWESIFKISVLFFLFYLIFLIKDILILFLFAALLAVLFDKPIEFLQKRGLPRSLSTALVYFLFFIFLGLIIYFIFPIFVSEITVFLNVLPQYWNKISNFFSTFGFSISELFPEIFQEWLKKEWPSILDFITSIFGGIFSMLTFLFLAFFLSLEKNIPERLISYLSPQKYEKSLVHIWHQTKGNVSLWFGTRFLGCIFVGLLTFLACLAFKVKYAVSLGLISGILNFLPILGPFLAGFLIFISTIFENFTKSILIIITFFIIQQIENNLFLPFLTKRFLQISPAIVFLSFLIGGKLLGIFGAIFSIPLFVLVFEFWKEFFREKKELEI